LNLAALQEEAYHRRFLSSIKSQNTGEMSNVRYPTYLLAPNWTFRPGGRVAIGNVMADPLLPHRALVRPDAGTALPVDIATENNWQLPIETTKSLSLSIRSVFLEKIIIKLGGNRTHIKNKQFNMESLETQTLKDDPSDEYIAQLCENTRVREFMRLDSCCASQPTSSPVSRSPKDFAWPDPTDIFQAFQQRQALK
jgi:hypothetical protein